MQQGNRVAKVSKDKFKGPYSPSSDDIELVFDDGMTEQHHQQSCDVNNIIKRFTQTGIMEHVREMEPMYGDFASSGDFLESQLKIKQAEEAFMSLPADLRKRFDNEPWKLLDFINNKNNKEEAINLGLISKPNTPVIDNSIPNKPVT